MFGKKRQTIAETRTEPTSVPVTEQDIATCASLVLAFADGADEDAATRAAARAIASAGSGIPATGTLPLGQVMLAERAPWRWLGSCAQAADPRVHPLLPIRVAYVAEIWTQIVAPHQTPADAGDTGLLGTPSDVLASILGLAVKSAQDIAQEQPIWPPDIDPACMSVAEARRGFAGRLLKLEGQGVPVDPEARALAATLVA